MSNSMAIHSVLFKSYFRRPKNDNLIVALQENSRIANINRFRPLGTLNVCEKKKKKEKKKEK